MSGEINFLKIQNTLLEARKGSIEFTKEQIDDMTARMVGAIQTSFSRAPREKFKLYPSNVGHPYCQLWFAKNSDIKPNDPYNVQLRNVYGHVLEALIISLIELSGIPIVNRNVRGKLKIGGIELSGELDIELEDGIWDVKSASQYSFMNTFGDQGGFQKLLENDHFGYVAQGFIYEEMFGKPFKGWIVVNKSTGELVFLEVPMNSAEIKHEVLGAVERTIRKLEEGAAFERDFGDVGEKYYGRRTGNRVLGYPCTECAYKRECWPNMQELPQICSNAKSPKLMYYTQLTEEDQKRVSANKSLVT